MTEPSPDRSIDPATAGTGLIKRPEVGPKVREQPSEEKIKDHVEGIENQKRQQTKERSSGKPDQTELETET